MKPDPDDPPIPLAIGLDQPDQEAIDDCIESLRRHASAQDYPLPEPQNLPHPVRDTTPRFSEYNDRRSLAADQNLDQPPVPGYTPIPFLIALTLDFGKPHMPSKSTKQAKLMAAAAHDPAFAKRAGIPQKVAKEFNRADAKSGILKRKTKQ